MCLFIQCWGPSSTLRYNGIESSVKTPCTQCLTHLTARCDQLDRMLHDVTDCCSVLCMLYAEETLGFCLKFKGFTSSSHHAANLAAVLSTLRTLSFCSFCCENLLCTLPFSQAALSQRGTARGTSHRQDGAQPITSFAASCVNVRQYARWKCQDPIFTAVQANGCAVFPPAKWLEMLELHQPYLQKSSNGM